MARKPKNKPSGIVTVMVLVGAAALLIVVGNWFRGTQPRRVPAGVGAPRGEILPEDREQLEKILEQKAKP